MNSFLHEYYGINALGIIKITSHVYKIKTVQHHIYYLKRNDSKDIITTFEYIESVHLKCFIPIIKNNHGDYLSLYNNHTYYLMPAVSIASEQFKELKMKNYFETLAYVHVHSSYQIKVNDDYFKTLYQDIKTVINQRNEYYYSLMSYYEKMKIRSPFQWLFVMNFYKIKNSLDAAMHYLEEYVKQTKQCDTVRVCLTYQNFDYQHISLKDSCFISLDHMKVDQPIYDIFSLYQKIPDILFDLDCFSQYYFHSMKFNHQEILLLSCLLSIVPMFVLEDDEISNIITLSRLLYYYDSILIFISSLSTNV